MLPLLQLLLTMLMLILILLILVMLLLTLVVVAVVLVVVTATAAAVAVRCGEIVAARDIWGQLLVIEAAALRDEKRAGDVFARRGRGGGEERRREGCRP